jgi:hypothetical protein
MVADIVPGATGLHAVTADGYRAVEVKSASTPLLAALVGTLNDLNQTIQYCDAYLAMFRIPGESLLVEDALWSSALISYFRACDANGKNAKVNLSLLDLVEGAREVHNHFRDLRSKYVAHSVNPLEQVSVVAILTDANDTDRAVFNIATGHVSFNPLDETGANNLKRLAQILGTDLQERVSDASTAVEREVNELGLDRVYGFRDVEFIIPDVETMSKPR